MSKTRSGNNVVKCSPNVGDEFGELGPKPVGHALFVVARQVRDIEFVPYVLELTNRLNFARQSWSTTSVHEVSSKYCTVNNDEI